MRSPPPPPPPTPCPSRRPPSRSNWEPTDDPRRRRRGHPLRARRRRNAAAAPGPSGRAGGPPAAGRRPDPGRHHREGESTRVQIDGATVGIAGTKGFGGGFVGACGSEFGEPEMKAFMAHSRSLAERLESALVELDTDVKVA